MQKTPFAGLTRLNPNESLSTDGFAFQDQDRALIDYFIELSLTHRHDGHPPLGDPIGAPSAAVETSGGAIGPDLTLHIGYTLIDDKGGETLLSETDVVSTEPPFDAPASAPVAEVEYGTGSILIGTYYYGLTLLDAGGGESEMSPWTQVERLPGDTNAQINLEGLTEDFADTGAVAWRLYRSKVGSHFDLLAEGTSDTYTDDGTTPVDCDVHPPSDFANTTNAANKVVVTVPSGAMGDATSFKLYASLDGAFNGSCLVGTFDTGLAGTDIDITSLAFLRGAPPDVSTSKGGLSKIDPDTEILDWPWKRSVATHDDLPAGSAADVRLVLDEGKAYYVPIGGAADADDWLALAGGGGGGGDGTLMVYGSNGDSTAPAQTFVPGVEFLHFIDPNAFGAPEAIVADEGSGSAMVQLPFHNRGAQTYTWRGDLDVETEANGVGSGAAVSVGPGFQIAPDDIFGAITPRLANTDFLWTTGTGGSPAASHVGIDTADWETATELHVSETDVVPVSVADLLDELGEGDRITVYSQLDGSSYATYLIAGPPIDEGTWRRIPVEPYVLGTQATIGPNPPPADDDPVGIYADRGAPAVGYPYMIRARFDARHEDGLGGTGQVALAIDGIPVQSFELADHVQTEISQADPFMYYLRDEGVYGGDLTTHDTLMLGAGVTVDLTVVGGGGHIIDLIAWSDDGSSIFVSNVLMSVTPLVHSP